MVTTTLYARQQKRHRCIEQSFGLFWEGGMIWENGIKTCIISYKKKGSQHKKDSWILMEVSLT